MTRESSADMQRSVNVRFIRLEPMTLVAIGFVACVGAGTPLRVLLVAPPTDAAVGAGADETRGARTSAAAADPDELPPVPANGNPEKATVADLAVSAASSAAAAGRSAPAQASNAGPVANGGFAPDATSGGPVAVGRSARCPPGTLPDDGACVKLPSSLEEESWGEDPVGAPEGEATLVGHHERSGRWLAYEQIPRRPDRPADYDAYLYPIPAGLPGGHSVVSGYDLDLPDPLQRRGRMRAVGHGGVDLAQRRGTPIKLLALEHQVGDARVIHVGRLFGLTVVTLHTLREGGRDREYVLIHGHVDAFADGLHAGQTLETGEVIAFVGDTGSRELVHLHLEARRVRDSVEGAKLLPGRILAPDATIVCDPRNVLPLKS